MNIVGDLNSGRGLHGTHAGDSKLFDFSKLIGDKAHSAISLKTSPDYIESMIDQVKGLKGFEVDVLHDKTTGVRRVCLTPSNIISGEGEIMVRNIKLIEELRGDKGRRILITYAGKNGDSTIVLSQGESYILEFSPTK